MNTTPKELRKPPTAPGTLAMLAEISELLGTSKRTCWLYTGRKDFPAPVDEVSAGPIWRASAVAKWGQKHLPLPVGRPPERKRKEPHG